MSEFVVFASEHPVTIRWTAPDGETLIQRARLSDVSDSRLMIAVPWREQYSPPIEGGQVTAEAADARGRCLALFHGTVKSVALRQIDIRLDRAMEVVQRREHPRARVPRGFQSAMLLSAEQSCHFLAHPLDLGTGGVRLLHRRPLQPGDGFQLTFRPRRDIALTPSAEVLESQLVTGPGGNGPTETYVTRARFFDLTDLHQRFLSRYVGWLLTNRG
jgi:hypothetical protein